MSIASVMSKPLNPSCLRSNPVMIAGLSVAGTDALSMAGTRPWKVIMPSMPAAIARRNGTSSTESMRARLACTVVMVRCEFSSVSPCPREMLPGGEDTVTLKAVDHGLSHVGDETRILAEGTHSDDRIRRIVVDVENRSESDVNTKRSRFNRGDASFLIGECRIASGAESHLVWEHRPAAEINIVREEVAATLTECHAGLVIGADHERQRAETLHGVELFSRLCR
jgi:hypothetical protein